MFHVKHFYHTTMLNVSRETIYNSFLYKLVFLIMKTQNVSRETFCFVIIAHSRFVEKYKRKQLSVSRETKCMQFFNLLNNYNELNFCIYKSCVVLFCETLTTVMEHMCFHQIYFHSPITRSTSSQLPTKAGKPA